MHALACAAPRPLGRAPPPFLSTPRTAGVDVGLTSANARGVYRVSSAVPAARGSSSPAFHMIRKIKGKIVPVLVTSAVMASHAMAQTTPTEFDPTAHTDKISTAITTSVVIVGGLVALSAGLMVWNIIRRKAKQAAAG